MLGFTYDPFCKNIWLKDGDDMPVSDFRQICYENNLVEELARIDAADAELAAAFRKLYLERFKKFIADNPQLMAQAN